MQKQSSGGSLLSFLLAIFLIMACTAFFLELLDKYGSYICVGLIGVLLFGVALTLIINFLSGLSKELQKVMAEEDQNGV